MGRALTTLLASLACACVAGFACACAHRSRATVATPSSTASPPSHASLPTPATEPSERPPEASANARAIETVLANADVRSGIALDGDEAAFVVMDQGSLSLVRLGHLTRLARVDVPSVALRTDRGAAFVATSEPDPFTPGASRVLRLGPDAAPVSLRTGAAFVDLALGDDHVDVLSGDGIVRRLERRSGVVRSKHDGCTWANAIAETGAGPAERIYVACAGTFEPATQSLGSGRVVAIEPTSGRRSTVAEGAWHAVAIAADGDGAYVATMTDEPSKGGAILALEVATLRAVELVQDLPPTTSVALFGEDVYFTVGGQSPLDGRGAVGRVPRYGGAVEWLATGLPGAGRIAVSHGWVWFETGITRAGGGHVPVHASGPGAAVLRVRR